MWTEFKAFLLKSNALALALAVVLGSALGNVVTSLVKDVIMPPVGLVLGRVDFSGLYVNLSGGAYPTLKAAQDAGAVTMNYGLFLNSIVGFLIVALVVFFIGRSLMKAPPAPPAPATKTCPRCLESILAAATRCRHCAADL